MQKGRKGWGTVLGPCGPAVPLRSEPHRSGDKVARDAHEALALKAASPAVRPVAEGAHCILKSPPVGTSRPPGRHRVAVATGLRGLARSAHLHTFCLCEQPVRAARHGSVMFAKRFPVASAEPARTPRPERPENRPGLPIMAARGGGPREEMAPGARAARVGKRCASGPAGRQGHGGASAKD